MPTEQNPIQAHVPTWARSDALLRTYYDTEWGLPLTSEREVFERLSLESFQAGLAWATVLRKRDALREAFEGFDVDKVAAMDDERIDALMSMPEIIRNRRKIEAVRRNARAARALRTPARHIGDFVYAHLPDATYTPQCSEDIPSKDEVSALLARNLKTVGFVFVGPVMAFALMEALGLYDTHVVGSPRRGASGVFDAHARLQAQWRLRRDRCRSLFTHDEGYDFDPQPVA